MAPDRQSITTNEADMKPEQKALSMDRNKVMIIAWIAESTQFFITCLRGHDKTDIDAGIEHAVDGYLNRGETPGSAIPMGVFHARQRIKQRRDAAISRAIALKFMAARRQTNRRAYVGI
jgi:hypothetical protein